MTPRDYTRNYCKSLASFARQYYGSHWKARVRVRTGMSEALLNSFTRTVPYVPQIEQLRQHLKPLGFPEPAVQFWTTRPALERNPLKRCRAKMAQDVYTLKSEHSSPVPEPLRPVPVPTNFEAEGNPQQEFAESPMIRPQTTGLPVLPAS